MFCFLVMQILANVKKLTNVHLGNEQFVIFVVVAGLSLAVGPSSSFRLAARRSSRPAPLKVIPAQASVSFSVRQKQHPHAVSSCCPGVVRLRHVRIQRCPSGAAGRRLQANGGFQGGRPPAEGEPGGWR